MKRFYKTVSVDRQDGGYGVLLDGRGVRTPSKQAIAIPSRQVAEAVAEEWRAQEEDIDPASMPILRLVNTAIDIVSRNREEVVANLSGYGEADLLYYFADGPADLLEAQVAAWRPVLDWAETEFAVKFTTNQGISYIRQDPNSLAALRRAVAAHDDMSLAAMNDLISISGSLLLALAHSHGALTVSALWEAARVDEAHQAARWGWDKEASQVAERRRREIEQAARFLALHRAGVPPAA